MNKLDYLKDSFTKEYGEKLQSKIKVLNILSNLIAGDNISLVENSLVFYDDKIALNIKKVNDEEEIVDGKIVIYDSTRYYYLEKNEMANTFISLIHDNCNFEIKYRSIYDDFDIERNMKFRLQRDKDGTLYMTSDLYNLPLSECYPNLKEKIEKHRSFSKNIGFIISDDIYHFLDFQLKTERKNVLQKSLQQRIYNRFEDAYLNENIDNDAKIQNEMAIVYDLVNHPSISLESINFEGKEGFNKYVGKEMANCIEINIMRHNGDEYVPGKFLLCGGKYIFYFDSVKAGNPYSNRVDIIPNNKNDDYMFEYKCKDNKEIGYIYNINLNYETQISGRGLARESISLQSIDITKEPTEENIKCIIPTTKYDSYHTDKSVYYLIGDLVSGKYINMINNYKENCKKKLK